MRVFASHRFAVAVQVLAVPMLCQSRPVLATPLPVSSNPSRVSSEQCLCFANPCPSCPRWSKHRLADAFAARVISVRFMAVAPLIVSVPLRRASLLREAVPLRCCPSQSLRDALGARLCPCCAGRSTRIQSMPVRCSAYRCRRPARRSWLRRRRAFRCIPSPSRRCAVQSEHCRRAALPRQADATRCLAVSSPSVSGSCIAIASPSLLCRLVASQSLRCRSLPQQFSS